MRDQLSNGSNGLMIIGLLLLKKGILLNNQLIDSLSNNVNYFKIANFDIFTSSEESKSMLVELQNDSSLYSTLILHLKAKA